MVELSVLELSQRVLWNLGSGWYNDRLEKHDFLLGIKVLYHILKNTPFDNPQGSSLSHSQMST